MEAAASSTHGFAPVSITFPLSIKLDDDCFSFLLWKMVASAAIIGHGLDDFISDSAPPPPKFLSEEDESVCRINQDYLRWKQQDRLLVSWLLSTMADSFVTKRIQGCGSARMIWKSLEAFFASRTRANVRLYKYQLITMKKGSLSVDDYLSEIRKLTLLLESAGHAISVEDQVEAIFRGLPAEYNSFVLAVTARLEPLTVEEVGPLLLAHEYRIEQRSCASREGGTDQRIRCQLCGKLGHGAAQCRHRFDRTFRGPV